ncbi:hypothetical protein B0H11DRAFT_202767 [Mycena galericulata]|nr:hypothetical protein B0H11DRAFT_202767 [Mycena galericulata]
MGRWTQFDEDSTRLPEGMKRIGYDADTSRYTFSDREGNIYMGPAHEEYGFLTLVGKSTRTPAVVNDRPHAFASEDSGSDLTVEVQSPGSASTFHDILPAHLITSPSSGEYADGIPLTGDGSAGARFRDAVRRATLPSMQNVVKNVRRSATLRKPRDQEKTGLLRSGSQASSKLSRSKSSATHVSFQSVDEKGSFSL